MLWKNTGDRLNNDSVKSRTEVRQQMEQLDLNGSRQHTQLGGVRTVDSSELECTIQKTIW